MSDKLKAPFWRCTNNKDEQKIVHQINSKNHVTGEYEGGLSVSETLAIVWGYNYKYVYQVTGDVVKHGSDGEPVLKNVKVASKMMKVLDFIGVDYIPDLRGNKQ